MGKGACDQRASTSETRVFMNVNGHPVSFVMLVSVRLHNHTLTASGSISCAFQQVLNGVILFPI